MPKKTGVKARIKRYRRLILPGQGRQEPKLKSALVRHAEVPLIIAKLPAKLRYTHKKLAKGFILSLEERLKQSDDAKQVLGRENIIGLGIGEKMKDGVFTGEPSITFHV